MNISRNRKAAAALTGNGCQNLNHYLVSDGRNKYSVPCNLIGERVDIRVTQNIMEVFYHGSRVTSHLRLQTVQRDPVVKPEHMPPEHRKYLNYNADSFKMWAATIGSMTSKVIQHFLTAGKAPEQVYKTCAILMKLESRYNAERLENACKCILKYSSMPSVRNISSILKNGQDKLLVPKDETNTREANSYGITRGAAYFRKGGKQK